jgi:hypothetical protein
MSCSLHWLRLQEIAAYWSGVSERSVSICQAPGDKFGVSTCGQCRNFKEGLSTWRILRMLDRMLLREKP